MRSILNCIPKKDSKPFREEVKALFKFTDIETTRKAKNTIASACSEQSKYYKVCEKLDEGLEDALQYVVVSKGQSRLKSMNLLERLNEKVKRREEVIRISPNHASANRLIGTALIDHHEDWLSSTRKYIQF